MTEEPTDEQRAEWDAYVKELRDAKRDLKQAFTDRATAISLAAAWRDHLQRLCFMAEVGKVAFHSQLEVAEKALIDEQPVHVLRSDQSGSCWCGAIVERPLMADDWVYSTCLQCLRDLVADLVKPDA